MQAHLDGPFQNASHSISRSKLWFLYGTHLYGTDQEGYNARNIGGHMPRMVWSCQWQGGFKQGQCRYGWTLFQRIDWIGFLLRHGFFLMAKSSKYDFKSNVYTSHFIPTRIFMISQSLLHVHSLTSFWQKEVQKPSQKASTIQCETNSNPVGSWTKPLH